MIWLIGNRGMLGSDVEKKLDDERFEYIASDIEVDITDIDKLRIFIGEKHVDWIINCSAYTAVDRAEDEPEKAFQVNTEGPFHLAEIAKGKSAKLIHISTDYVFDGEVKGAYTEEDRPNPKGVYGKSKLEGEGRIKSLIQNYFILRTAWLYGKEGNNFVYTMLRLFKEKRSVKVVSDQWGSPTYTKDIAEAILHIVKINSDSFGIYHFTNRGKTNWYEFAREIYEKARENGLVKNDVKITPITSEEYPTRAIRPRNSHLSKEKIQRVFHISIRDWEYALEDFIMEIRGNKG